MRLLRLCSVTILAMLVQACGSSESNNSSTSSGNSSLYTFTLNAVLTNDCGVSQPFTDVELLLQDEDWAWIQSYSPDENGTITFTTSDKNINYTLVAKTQSGSDEEGLDIVSYYQAQTSLETTYQATYDSKVNNDTCQCITQDVMLRHRAFDNVTEAWTSLPFDSWQNVSSTETLFSDVTACRVIDGDWPLASFMVKGTDASNERIGAADFMTDFATDGSEQWTVSAVEVAEEVGLSKNHQGMTIYQQFQDGVHFRSSITEDEDTALLFTSHIYVNEALYHGSATQLLSESSNVYGAWSIISEHQVSSTAYSDALAVSASDDLPDIDTVSFSELGDDGAYDYSAVKNYPMAIISFTYGYTSMPVTWTTFGPISGTLPTRVDLVGYEDIVNSDSYISATEINLLKSESSSKYSDYIEYFQSLDNDDFIAELYQYNITIQ